MTPSKHRKRPILYALACSAALTLLAAGCATRTYLVPEGQPVQLREAVNAEVWIFDRNGQPVPGGRVTIPAGWYALPDSND